MSRVLDMVALLKDFLEALPSDEGYKTRCQDFLQRAKSYRDGSAQFICQCRGQDKAFEFEKFKEDFILPYCSALSDELESAFYDDLSPSVQSLFKLFISPIQSPSVEPLARTLVEIHLKKLNDLYNLVEDGDDDHAELAVLIEEYERFSQHLALMKMAPEGQGR
jgi:hypothetical protein